MAGFIERTVIAVRDLLRDKSRAGVWIFSKEPNTALDPALDPALSPIQLIHDGVALLSAGRKLRQPSCGLSED
jgi:hypothetical protein